MSDFQTRTTVRSRKQRACPECRAGIGIGQRYRKEIGCWEGDFYTAIMCEPCGVFTDRYFASMHQAGFLCGDEAAVTFGSIIDEAAEYVGLEGFENTSLTLPQKREAVHAQFEAFDEAEKAWQRRERETRKATERAARRVHNNRWFGRLIARGMAACSVPPASAPAQGGVR